ncbi:hypothetical protein ACN47E_003635 [Coniothyrium glycines]
MKTSAVLASALLSALAIAAPVDKRALIYHTEVVTETVIVYTTVYEDDYVPEATSTPEGLFYEQPEASSSVVVVPTSSPAPAPTPKVQQPSVAPAPAPQTPSPAPVVAPTSAPVAEQPKEEPKEEPKPTSAAYVAPAAPVAPVAEVVPSAAPAAPTPATYTPSTGSTGSGESFSNVDMTVYDNNGGFGACGTVLHDTDYVAAIAKDAWGASTYDPMTGAATNKWCGQKINVTYNGKTVPVTIMDLCPGCSGHDIDLSWAAWKDVTGTSEATRFKASWTMA